MFRDGVPLNEHFLALKTKYTNERDHFEKLISDIVNEVQNIDSENKYFALEIENTNKNYYEIMEKISQNTDFYTNKTGEINAKLINENNSKESLMKDKEILGKSVYRFTSENVHHNRTLEKNKLFKENKEEKNRILREKCSEKFSDIDKLVLRSLLEQEGIYRKLENNSKQKQIENENSTMIFSINKYIFYLIQKG